MRTYVFIDTQNLIKGVQAQGWQLDFRKFNVYLRDKYKAIQVFLVLGFLPRHIRRYIRLAKYGYTIVFKPVVFSRKYVKGNVDVDLTIQVLERQAEYDAAVIVTGDGDFYSLIALLEQKRKLAGLLIPSSIQYSKLLKEFRHRIIYLDLLETKLKKERGSNLRTKP